MDFWNRFPVPFTRGWNNPGALAGLTVTYDPDTDTLTIESVYPIFSNLDLIQFEGSTSSGSVNSGQFVITTPSLITIEDASDVFNATNELTQFDFFTADSDLIAIWVGSVLIGEIVELTAIYDDDDHFIIISGPGLSTFDIVEWTTTGGSGTATRDTLPAADPDVVFINPDIFMINIDPGETLTGLVVKDALLVTLGSWTGSIVLTPSDNAFANSAGVVPQGGGEVDIYGQFFLTAALGPIDEITVSTISGPFVYYVPGSPNVALNPPGSTVSVPTDRMVTVTDAGLVGETVDFISLADVDNDYSTTVGITPNVLIT